MRQGGILKQKYHALKVKANDLEAERDRMVAFLPCDVEKIKKLHETIEQLTAELITYKDNYYTVDYRLRLLQTEMSVRRPAVVPSNELEGNGFAQTMAVIRHRVDTVLKQIDHLNIGR